MLRVVDGCHLLVLVAWIWSTFLCQALARPQLAANAPTPLLKPSYTNSSISSLSPLTTSGSCWKCGIEAPGGIRLVYWQPDSAAAGGPNITLGQTNAQPYTQVENGFTYTSPSVYVIYSSLQGTAACSTESGLYAVGPSFAEKTIAYSSRFLAYGTLSIADAGCSEFVVVGGFHTIDFSSLYYNPITTTTTYKAGCTPYVNPRLSLPHELTNVDPRWENCEPLFYGAFDPPSVLTKASGGLVPSPVGAGQVTQPAVAQPMSELAPAAPAVTLASPVAPPTNEPGNGKSWLQGDGKPNPQEIPTPMATVVANQAPNTQTKVDSVFSIQLPHQQQAEEPSVEDQAGPSLTVAGNSQGAQAQASPPTQSALPAQPSGSLGEIINSPFVPQQNGANLPAEPGPVANSAPSIQESGSPAVGPSHVAVPVEMVNGKPAYAIVDAEPVAFGGSAAQIAALPTAESSDSQQTAIDNQKEPDITGAEPTPGPTDTTKVTLDDGSIADIPTADIIQPAQPQQDQSGEEPSVSGLQSVHLNAGAFIAVPGVHGTPSSIAVQGGDYLLPRPTEDMPQQTLTLLGGQTTAIPLETPSQLVTLQGGAVTNIPINAPSQVLTLANGELSTFSPIPDSTVTLANGQATTVSGANAVAGIDETSINTPLQILTLQNGQTTAVPIQVAPQIFTLKGGSVTTLLGDTPPQAFTLADGQVSTISPVPFTTVTLANGETTSIPDINPVAGIDSKYSNLPLETLTLNSGEVTIVPFAASSQAFTLQGGKVKTLEANSPPETLTLANGKITTVSSNPLTAVTLADGQVTSIPADYTPQLTSSDDFLTIPDATISGKVHYTRVPIVQLKKAGSAQSQINSTGQSDSSILSSSALATTGYLDGASITGPTSISTQSGTEVDTPSSTTNSIKKSKGNKIWLGSGRGILVSVAAVAMGLGLT